MPRKKDDERNILDSLAETMRYYPWWAGLVMVPAFWVITYLAVILFSLIFKQNETVSSFFNIQHMPWAIASLVALLVFIAWLISLLMRYLGRELLAQTSSLQELRQLDWQDFEKLVAEAFRRQGHIATVTPKGPDGGIDIVLTGNGQRRLVQCKHWKTMRVGVKPVRELAGVVTQQQADAGIFVITGTYTDEAIDFAQSPTAKLTLIDGPQLLKLIEGLLPNTKKSKHAPTQEAPTTPPACPICGETMVRRTAKRGPNTGSNFWGCSRYPNCNGTRSINK